MSAEREWRYRQTRVRYSRPGRGRLRGRFGGGWDWSLGVRLGGRTLMVDLLVATIRIDRRS